MNQTISQWGIQLTGHHFDLLDWEETLKAPFDPWVERMQEIFVLRWSGFDDLDAAQVHARGEPLVEQLNGAMAASKGSRPLRRQDVIHFAPDGTRRHHMLEAFGLELRSKGGAAIMRVIGPDGAAVPDAPPQPSDVHRWTSIADTDDRLADALVYLGRREWFDLFKAIECIEDWAGGEGVLIKLGWMDRDKRVKRTANSFRHRRDGSHSPPSPPATHEEALRFVADLIRKAFEAAEAHSHP
ncbi:hypothetical protein CT676_38490 [Bradyrhizobium sp. MOS001]|uniref:hypothetical protein n=1 Tax=Bradyrhizobium sp. MOS001 TaxID=2133948 RepID=UPI001074ED35|nr:hypothetical protein [Bradyrhizobium sp. MOS001]TFW55798.1 hypothetical protein CT676_38490 [Bradyrhizobium sp. MOS001]